MSYISFSTVTLPARVTLSGTALIWYSPTSAMRTATPLSFVATDPSASLTVTLSPATGALYWSRTWTYAAL